MRDLTAYELYEENKCTWLLCCCCYHHHSRSSSNGGGGGEEEDTERARQPAMTQLTEGTVCTKVQSHLPCFF